MVAEPKTLFCTSCAQELGALARCSRCGAANEFLGVPAPTGCHEFQEKALWTPEAIEEALHAEGVSPTAPEPASSSGAESGTPSRDEPAAPNSEASFELDELLGGGAGGPREAAPPPESRSAPAREEESPPPSLDRSHPEATVLLDPDPDVGHDDEPTLLLDEDFEDPLIARLVRVSAPGAGEFHDIYKGRITFGTRDTDIVLDRKLHRAISRRHAGLVCEWHEGQYRLTVTDAGSSNGTFVNGRRISEPTLIVDGDAVWFADVKFRLEVFA